MWKGRRLSVLGRVGNPQGSGRYIGFHAYRDRPTEKEEEIRKSTLHIPNEPSLHLPIQGWSQML